MAHARPVEPTTMKLLLKFNLIFVLVMAVGVALSGWISRGLLQQQAQEEVLAGARLMMEQASAVRAYTSGQITKLLDERMKVEFLPQSVPSYSATEVLATVRTTHPEYAYKEATLNPTNPSDLAEGWEAEVVNSFRAAPDTPALCRACLPITCHETRTGHAEGQHAGRQRLA